MSHRKPGPPVLPILRGLVGAAALGACALLMTTNVVGCAVPEDNGGEGGSSGSAGQGPAGSNGSGTGGSSAAGEGGHIAPSGEGGHIDGEGGHDAAGAGGSTATGEGGTAAGGRGGGNPAGGRGGDNEAGGRGGGSAAGGPGGGLAAGGRGGGSAAGGRGGAGAATFAAVGSILMGGCAGTSKCHGNGTTKTDLRNNSGLYGRLVNAVQVGLTMCSGKIVVVPGDPAASLLYQKVSGTGIPAGCGDRMPDGCPSKGACLTSAQIGTIRDWIMAGAPM